MDSRTGKLYRTYDEAPQEARPYLREVDGDELSGKQKRLMKIGRNEPCPCKSGAKFKKCCMMRLARGEGYRLELNKGAGLTPEEARAKALNDECPNCGGDLDTGYECNTCGYDALPLIRQPRA